MNNRKLWVSLLAGFLAAMMLFSLFAGLIPHADAAKQSSKDIKNQINSLKQQKKELAAKQAALKKQQTNNRKDMKAMVADKKALDQQVELLYAQVANINDQLTAYNLLIADKQEELDAAEARLEELNEQYKERIRAMEENGSISYWSVLFEANSFSDLLDRLNMIEEIASADQQRLKELEAAAKEVAAAREEMIAEKEELAASKEELVATETELQEKILETDELLKALIAKDEEYDRLMEESEDLEDELLADIAQKEKDYDAAKDREFQEWLKKNQKTGGVIGNTVNGIAWAIPCTYSKVSSAFGMRTHPISGKWKMHNGVDLVGATRNEILGKPIYATRAGKVTIATWSDTAGWYVTINHGDGYSSVYMHMTHYIVKKGQYVTQGQVIGYVGSSGGSTGPHLHFGISYKGEYVNPMKYIKK